MQTLSLCIVFSFLLGYLSPGLHLWGGPQKNLYTCIDFHLSPSTKEIHTVKIKTRNTLKVKSPQLQKGTEHFLSNVFSFFPVLPLPQSAPVGLPK